MALAEKPAGPPESIWLVGRPGMPFTYFTSVAEARRAARLWGIGYIVVEYRRVP
jgi:hypothetical protein